LKALQRLLDLLPAISVTEKQQIEYRDSKSKSHTTLSLLMYVDEAHTIADHFLEKFDMSTYDIMLRALNEYTNESDFFTVFMSTSSRTSCLAERAAMARSSRKRGSAGLIPPYVEMPFDCHPKLLRGIEPGKLGLEDVWDLPFLLRFGRPLYACCSHSGIKMEA
jgi:hypothetical protein